MSSQIHQQHITPISPIPEVSIDSTLICLTFRGGGADFAFFVLDAGLPFEVDFFPFTSVLTIVGTPHKSVRPCLVIARSLIPPPSPRSHIFFVMIYSPFFIIFSDWRPRICDIFLVVSCIDSKTSCRVLPSTVLTPINEVGDETSVIYIYIHTHTNSTTSVNSRAAV